MIEPYGTALRNCAGRFAEVGFSLVRNADHSATFSDGSYSIEICTDRYCHPGLAISFRNPAGRVFELATLQQILDAERFAENTRVLRALCEQYGLNHRDTATARRAQGIAEHVWVNLAQVLDFVDAFKDRLFTMPNEYEAEYAIRRPGC